MSFIRIITNIYFFYIHILIFSENSFFAVNNFFKNTNQSEEKYLKNNNFELPRALSF